MFVSVNLAMAHEKVRTDVQKNEITKQKFEKLDAITTVK